MKATVFLVVLALLLLVAGTVWAANGFDLGRQVTGAGGGGPVHAGAYALRGSVGQAVVGPVQAPGFGLASGFWDRAVQNRLYLPVVLRNAS